MVMGRSCRSKDHQKLKLIHPAPKGDGNHQSRCNLFTHFLWIPNMGWITINHIQGGCFDPSTNGVLRMFDTADSSHVSCVFGGHLRCGNYSELTNTSPKMIVYVWQLTPGRTFLPYDVFINQIYIYIHMWI